MRFGKGRQRQIMVEDEEGKRNSKADFVSSPM